MMKFSTEINKVVIRVESDHVSEQAETLSLLLGEILNSPPYAVMEKNIVNNVTNYKEYMIYYNLIPIGTITTETIPSIKNRFGCMQVLILEFDRLKMYDEIIDNASLTCLFHCTMLLNEQFILFELKEVGICLDAVCEPNHDLGMKSKNSSRVNQATKYRTTGRIENISNQLLQNDIRRLTYTLNLENFNHLNANIEVFKATSSLYDFFYFNYEEELIKSDICLDMDFIESFVGALFYTTEHNS